VPRARLERDQVRVAVEALTDRLYQSASYSRDAAFGEATRVFLQFLAGAILSRLGRASDSEARSIELFRPAGDLVLDVHHDTVSRVTGLLADLAPPHSLLTNSYEYLQSFSPVADSVTGAIRLKAGTKRKAHGIFYTPSRTARVVANVALDIITAESPPRVLDPAMGTGIFLLEAARCISAREHINVATVAETCLWGTDTDPLAVELAVLGLWLETGARPAVLAQRLRRADALTEDCEEHDVDLVVSNPPWGALYLESDRAPLARRFPDVSKLSFDSFKLFLNLGVSRTRRALAMVVPHAVLAQPKYADVRALLIERLPPYHVLDLGNRHFPKVAAPACALICGPTPGPSHVHAGVLSGEGELATGSPIPRSHWTAFRGFLLARPGILRLVDRLQKDHPSLRDLGDLYRVRDGGINYNRAALGNRVLYQSLEPDDARDIPRYRGRNFGRYTGIERGGWLRHDAARRLEPGEKLSMDLDLYDSPGKLVFRQTADRLTGTMDRTRMALGRSVIAITAVGDVSLLPLLACLNSRLLTVVYRSLSGEGGRLLPQVKVSRLLALPIPDVSGSHQQLVPQAPESSGDHSQLTNQAGMDRGFAWACLGELARQMLLSQGQDVRRDTMIDDLVGCLYGLSERDLVVMRGSSAR